MRNNEEIRLIGRASNITQDLTTLFKKCATAVRYSVVHTTALYEMKASDNLGRREAPV